MDETRETGMLAAPETPPDAQGRTQGPSTAGGTPETGTGDSGGSDCSVMCVKCETMIPHKPTGTGLCPACEKEVRETPAAGQIVPIACECGHDFEAMAGDYVTCPKCTWRHSVGTETRLTAEAVPVVCECEYHFFAYPTKNRLVPCPECDKSLIIPMANVPTEVDAERIADLAKAEGWQIEVREAAAAVDAAGGKMGEAEAALAGAKGRLKAAEADFGVAVAELRETIKGQTQPRLPLQPGGPEDGQGPGPDDTPALKLDLQHTDEAWLAIHLDELGLTGRVVDWLRDGGLETIGDVAKWSNDGHHLPDIRGIGPAAQKKVEDAIDRHWEEWSKRARIDQADGVEPDPAEENVTEGEDEE